jgi:hypothetical protein
MGVYEEKSQFEGSRQSDRSTEAEEYPQLKLLPGNGRLEKTWRVLGDL